MSFVKRDSTCVDFTVVHLDSLDVRMSHVSLEAPLRLEVSRLLTSAALPDLPPTILSLQQDFAVLLRFLQQHQSLCSFFHLLLVLFTTKVNFAVILLEVVLDADCRPVESLALGTSPADFAGLTVLVLQLYFAFGDETGIHGAAVYVAKKFTKLVKLNLMQLYQYSRVQKVLDVATLRLQDVLASFALPAHLSFAVFKYHRRFA